MQYIEARYFTRLPSRSIRVLVIHDMEAPEKGTTAENVARFFANNPNKTSAHYCIDNDSEVQSVPDSSVAYAAPGANSDGLHFELAGYAAQRPADWDDEFSRALLARTAKLVAAKAKQYNIPVRKLSASDLRDKSARGIVGHADVSDAFHQTTHRDPGPNFPWDSFVQLVAAERAALDGGAGGRPAKPAAPDSGPTAPAFPLPSGHYYGEESNDHACHSGFAVGDRDDIARWQRRMVARGYDGIGDPDGRFGPKSAAAARAFQNHFGLGVDGRVGPVTWRQSWEAKLGG
jgi:N-acetyl-anhydromuramyl-L-alanine amidase AmpD